MPRARGLELTGEQRAAIIAGRQALADAIRDAAGDDKALWLILIAVGELFAETITASEGAREIVVVLNAQLRQAGLQIVPLA